MNFPDNLHYTKDHEWIKTEGKEAIVGITDFAQGELGDIVFVDINAPGKQMAAGDVFGTIEAVKTVSDMFMPVSGKVIAVNAAVQYMLLMHGLMKQPASVTYSKYVVWSIVIVILFGALTEILQAILPSGRDADVMDWLADCVGTLLAFIVFRFRWKMNKNSA